MFKSFKMHSLVALFATCLVACSTISQDDQNIKELRVMSSGGFTAAYKVLGPQFEAETGYTLVTEYGASSGGAPDSIPERLKRGEQADVVILSANGLKNITEAGHIDPSTHTELAHSTIGLAVREGLPVPDISTEAAFKQSMLDANSIGYSASASGTYLSTKLFPSMGIWEAIKDKSTRVVSERVGAVVARGDVEMGFQQVSEILPIEGITYVGEIPTSLQKVTTFSTGIANNAEDRTGAEALIEFLSSSQNIIAIEKTGLIPAAKDQLKAAE